MGTGSQFGRPYLIANFEDGASARSLDRFHLHQDSNGSGGYSERWVQELVMRHPNLLPIDEIEPALTPAIPVCMELPVPSGYVDNLLVTPDGGIILVECKLWRNPEARREVVGQIIDYAKDLAGWSYEDLQRALERSKATGTGKPPHLFDYVKDAPDVDEARFVDGISRNLKRGRFLLLIVGDGIREGVEAMTSFLQNHAGLHFTLSLVELAIFPTPTAGYLVQPRVLMKTVTIERGIVTVEDKRISLQPSHQAPMVPDTAKRSTISEEQFFEEIGRADPSVSVGLRKFLNRLEDLAVTAQFGKGLILRWQPDENHRFNLGAIYTNLEVVTDAINWAADNVGRIDLAQQYLRSLAQCVEGGSVRETPNRRGWYVRTARGALKVTDLLAAQDCWVQAIQAFTAEMAETLRSNS